MKTWISVNDRMPDKDEHVLVAFDDGFIATVSTDDLGDWELWADSGEPTHWMPLPEPPRVEQAKRIDRIRQMTTEELADLIIKSASLEFDAYCKSDCDNDDPHDEQCLGCLVRWLNEDGDSNA